MNNQWIYNDNGEVIANFLKSKGFKTPEEAKDYLHFSLSNLREDYKDLNKVTNRICKAIKNNENIVIYGDYDCDGITATSIAILALRNIGVEANYFINNRFTEGYGMNLDGVYKMLNSFPETDLVITCDNGIAANAGIQAALDAGVDVVVTDHHLQKQDEKLLVPTVDEWRLDEDVEKREECCGAEIIRRVMLAVYKKLGKDTTYIENLITFSGIATVADVVKFTKQNRCIVKRCLELLNEPLFPIINVIKEVMNIEEVDEETLGFQFGPLMNALSRVTGSPDEMVDILTSKKNTLDVYEKVKSAVEINEERKQMSLENYERAKEQFNPEKECIVIAGQYDAGIAGIVCSQVVENYCRPCITLCEMEDGVFKGSARSYLDFHLKEALDKCSDLLIAYGGHAGAAGLSIKKENIPEFEERICSLVRESKVLEEVPVVKIDYECSISNMFDDNVMKLMALAPFGEGFEKPRIVYRGGFKTLSFSPKNEEIPKHVSFTLKDKTGEVKAVWFNAYQKWLLLEPGSKSELRVLGAPRIDKFNDRQYRKIYVEDIKIA